VLDHSCQVQRHLLAERGVDLYETPAVAVEALLRVHPLPAGAIWEPACGRGAIANVLRAHGHTVVCTDLIDYGVDPTARYGVDFLKESELPAGVTAVVTNPPYMLANEFVARALELCPHVVMLLRLAFLESERRSPILDDAGLKRVFVFRRRLPMMHRDGWEGRKANSGMAFAWMFWEHGYRGHPTTRRISWEAGKWFAIAFALIEARSEPGLRAGAPASRRTCGFGRAGRGRTAVGTPSARADHRTS
jgi:hypothetical protein